MSICKGARALILLALGSPETDDAPLAIRCVLSSLHAEAEMLQMGENINNDVVLEIAHVSRLKAFEGFLDDYVNVTWRETAEERAPVDGDRKPTWKQALRAVQTGGAS
ncbi:MAG: hypothetical protein WDO69_24330 [Pseudomonadota bacterium]